MTLLLTHEEIVELTERKTRPAQVRQLCHMGIQHKVRMDGSIAVLREHVINSLDGNAKSQKTEKKIEPNWGALNATQEKPGKHRAA